MIEGAYEGLKIFYACKDKGTLEADFFTFYHQDFEKLLQEKPIEKICQLISLLPQHSESKSLYYRVPNWSPETMMLRELHFVEISKAVAGGKKTYEDNDLRTLHPYEQEEWDLVKAERRQEELDRYENDPFLSGKPIDPKKISFKKEDL